MAFLDISGGSGGVVTVRAVPQVRCVRSAASGDVLLSGGAAQVATFKPLDAGPTFTDGVNVYPMMLGGKDVRTFITDADQVIIDYVNAAISAGSISLPPATGNLGKALIVRNVGAPPVEVLGAGLRSNGRRRGASRHPGAGRGPERHPGPRLLWRPVLMAGIIQPNVFVTTVDQTLANIGVAPPVGKAESLCLCAALPSAVPATDAYLTVLMADIALGQNAVLLFQEPIRYRQSGGSPVLLMNFILTAQQYILVQGADVGRGIVVTMFNRWRFDA